MTSTPGTSRAGELLRVVVDVQHLYRPSRPNDRGSVYHLANGATIAEADATVVYAAAAVEALRGAGAVVMTNDVKYGILVGPYSTRNRVGGGTWGGHAYLACHLNAGGGSYALVEHMPENIARPLESSRLARILAGKLKSPADDIPVGKSKILLPGERGAVCIEAVPQPCAAVILEPFFGDNPHHQHLLAYPQLCLIGHRIAAGVLEWWSERPVTA